MNKKLSLLELIIATTIIAVLLGSLYSLVLDATKSYELETKWLLFEYRVHKTVSILNDELRQAWVRRKRPLPMVPPLLPPRLETSLTLITNPALDESHDTERNLLYYSLPHPTIPFDPDLGITNWFPTELETPNIIGLKPVDLDKDSITDLVREDKTLHFPYKSRDLNGDRDKLDVFELYEVSWIKRTPTSVTSSFLFEGRCFILKELATPPLDFAPCVLERSTSKSTGLVKAIRFRLLFYDLQLGQSLPMKFSIVPLNIQKD